MRQFHTFSTIVDKLAYILTNYFTTITISKKENTRTCKKKYKSEISQKDTGRREG